MPSNHLAPRSLTITAIGVLLAVSQASAQTRTIAVVGKGMVEATPDRVRVSVAVSERAESPIAAKTRVDAVVTRLLQVCHDLKITDEHVTADDLSIEPIFHHELTPMMEIVGYEVFREIDVALTAPTDLNVFIHRALEAGINSIGAVTLESSEYEVLLAEARLKAIEDAKAQAVLLAGGFGVELGPLQYAQASSSEWGSTHNLFGDPGEPRLFRFGPIRIGAQVSATFSLR